MKKRTKVIFGVLAAVIGLVIFLLANSFYAMDIEDHYGDLQTVYYQSDNGDLIIDNKNRYGFLKKVANRIYVEEDDCMRDLYNWINMNQVAVKFSVYKLKVYETWITRPSYQEMKRLIKEQNLEPIVNN